MILKLMQTFAASLLAIGILMGPAQAAQDDPRLDELFERLAKSPDPRQARALAEAIVEVWHDANSPSINLLLDRGLTALDEEDISTALSLFNAIVDLRPDFAEGWHARASLFFVMENYDQALADIQKTLELEPRHFGALIGLSSIFSVYGEYKKALETYRQALKINPHLPGSEERIKTLTDKVEGRKI